VEDKNLKCVCGHKRKIHATDIPGLGSLCNHTTSDGILYDCDCEDFKLDNLSYIEAVAKERNLI
jgi:hypothetical protein